MAFRAARPPEVLVINVFRRLASTAVAVLVATLFATAVLAADDSSGSLPPAGGGPHPPDEAHATPVGAGLATDSIKQRLPPATAATDAFDPTRVALDLSLFKSGFASPLLVTNAHDGSDRLVVVEQAGDVKVIQGGATLTTPLLDLRGAITSGGERGLLGLAFDPGFPALPYIYVDFTDVNGDTAISRYTVPANSNVAVPSTGVRILTIDQPYANHNGGNLAFGPDGFLYIGMGDGGSAGDPQNRAQNINSPLGKMLRIDVHHGTRTHHYTAPRDNPYVGRTGNDLIWSRGLRNPWRWSFDPVTKALWIGDVGQDRWEEIDRSLVSGTTRAGRAANYGWSTMEGRVCFKPASGCSTTGKQLPLSTYGHVVAGTDNCAVTGGAVYRGSASPVMAGVYLFGDFCSGRIWGVSAIAHTPTTPTLLRDATADPHLAISSFGSDESGELYVTDLNGGSVYRISATAKP